MACTGATTSVCTGLTNSEPCQVPKVYSATVPALEGLELSFDTTFVLTWDTDVSYPSQVVRGFIRKSGTIGFASEDIVIVSRDTGTLLWPTNIVLGELYRITLRPESATEFGDSVTVEVTAEVTAEELNGYPIGQTLVVVGSEEILLGTEYVYI